MLKYRILLVEKLTLLKKKRAITVLLRSEEEDPTTVNLFIKGGTTLDAEESRDSILLPIWAASPPPYLMTFEPKREKVNIVVELQVRL